MYNERITLEDIAKTGAIIQEMLDFLKMALDSRMTIIINGQNNTGKSILMTAIEVYLTESNPRSGVSRGNFANKYELKKWLYRSSEYLLLDNDNDFGVVNRMELMRIGQPLVFTTSTGEGGRSLERCVLEAMANDSSLSKEEAMKFVGIAVDIIITLGKLETGGKKCISIDEVVYTEGKYTESPQTRTDEGYEKLVSTSKVAEKGVPELNTLYAYSMIDSGNKVHERVNKPTSSLIKKLRLAGIPSERYALLL